MGYLLTTLARFLEASLLSIGSHLSLGLGGILFFGFPAAFWCGAYGYAVAMRVGLGLGLSLGIGLVLAALAGAIFAFFYTRVSNDSFAMITLAAVLAMDALIRSWSAVTGGVLGISGVPRFASGQTLEELVLIQTILVVLGFGLEWLLLLSPFGRSLRALKENKEALISLGTSASMIGQITLIFASLFAGVAGILAAMRIQFLDPSLGGLILLAQIITIAIIVQTPKVSRLLLMTLVIVLIPEFLRFLDLPSTILGYLRNLLYSLVLILLIYYVTLKTSIKRYV